MRLTREQMDAARLSPDDLEAIRRTVARRLSIHSVYSHVSGEPLDADVETMARLLRHIAVLEQERGGRRA